MIISLFRTSHPVSYILLPVLGILLRIPLMLVAESSGDQSLYTQWEWDIVSRHWLNVLLAGIVSGLVGIYINYISDKYGFLERVSGLAGLSFVLLTTWSPQAASFSSAYVAMIFVVIAIDQLFSLGRNGGLSQIFNSALCISIASLFLPVLIVVQPLVLFAIIYFQSIHWRQISVWLIGLSLPIVYFAVSQMIASSSDEVGFKELFSLQWGSIDLTAQSFLQGGLLLITLLLSMKSFRKGLTKNTTRIRKSFLLIIWILVFFLITVFKFEVLWKSTAVLLAIPLAFMFSNYLFYTKKSRLAELVLLLMICVEIANYWF